MDIETKVCMIFPILDDQDESMYSIEEYLFHLDKEVSYQRKKLPVSFTASLTRDQIDFLRGQDYVGKVLENTGPGSAVLLSRVYDDYDPFVDGPVL